VHTTARVLDARPKHPQPDTTAKIAAIDGTPTRADALSAIKDFADAFAGHPKAVAKITGELDHLLAFSDFPAEHWVHLPTTNPIESTFSTVRLRTQGTRGAGSRKAALAMAYKLLDAAQARWHRIGGAELVPLARAGAIFVDDKLQERSETTDTPEPDPTDHNGSVAA
jgi:transposase-like protein